MAKLMVDVRVVPALRNGCCGYLLSQIPSPPSSYKAALITEGKHLDAEMGFRIQATDGRPGSFQVVIPPHPAALVERRSFAPCQVAASLGIYSIRNIKWSQLPTCQPACQPKNAETTLGFLLARVP